MHRRTLVIAGFVAGSHCSVKPQAKVAAPGVAEPPNRPWCWSKHQRIIRWPSPTAHVGAVSSFGTFAYPRVTRSVFAHGVGLSGCVGPPVVLVGSFRKCTET